MMAPTYVGTAPVAQVPYLTPAGYRSAPTAVDTTTMNAWGGVSDSEAELLRVISRASSWIDSYLWQPLYHTTMTINRSARPDRNGLLWFYPWRVPIISLISATRQDSPTSGATPLDVTTARLHNPTGGRPVGVGVLAWPTAYSGSSLLQFGQTFLPSEVWASLTYVGGYGHSALTLPMNAGDSTLTVIDGSGFAPGGYYKLGDSEARETALVLSVTGNVVTLTAPVAYAHAAGDILSAMPADIREAAIRVVSAFLKVRGNGATVMDSRDKMAPAGAWGGEDIAQASAILDTYRRAF